MFSPTLQQFVISEPAEILRTTNAPNPGAPPLLPLSLPGISFSLSTFLLISVWNWNAYKKNELPAQSLETEERKECDDAQKWPWEFRKHPIIPGRNEVAMNWGLGSKLRKGKGSPRLVGYWEGQSGAETSGFVINLHAQTLYQDTLF